ncbi:MAG: PEP-CTERM sorting domain-containing protein [Bryobacteraceae bacterium]
MSHLDQHAAAAFGAGSETRQLRIHRAAAIVMLAAAWMGLPSRLEAGAVNVVVVVDESRSMVDEHAWLPGMMHTLSMELINLGYAPTFGLYGFGYGGAVLGRELLDNGTAEEFATASAGLVASGGAEDGYAGIDFAFRNFSFTPGAAVNVILVTDEDRDTADASLTFASTLALLQGRGALLNAVVNNVFTCDAGAALGIDSFGNGYNANGAGGYSTCSNGAAGEGFGRTTRAYVKLALETTGASWDLNQLRAGGPAADSFTEAFIDIKVREIGRQVTAQTPEPGSITLVALGLAAVCLARKRRQPAK